ncbi:hypothetical protein RHGRI_006485 [Rhododendron griersonianum]|uniref:Uncharacterized protein n=1 Tax=Rhododendron griersonianum TaxID=479676 RepID=A0AAV6KT64_9ERIC|nr:hypothetical protein RHGRI_006485 [Rhododendron griersonianum]
MVSFREAAGLAKGVNYAADIERVWEVATEAEVVENAKGSVNIVVHSTESVNLFGPVSYTSQTSPTNGEDLDKNCMPTNALLVGLNIYCYENLDKNCMACANEKFTSNSSSNLRTQRDAIRNLLISSGRKKDIRVTSGNSDEHILPT